MQQEPLRRGNVIWNHQPVQMIVLMLHDPSGHTFEGDSQAYWFEGTYSEYEENRKKRLGDEGPKRIKYRKLVRG